MNIETVCNQQWYLALYITGGKNRENLFDWLHDRRITPWTPLSLTQIRRADAPHVFRKRISAVFPGYFFLKADFESQKIDMIRAHSAFCDFVKFGSKIAPVNTRVVEALMKKYPDPT
ncbi:transcription termination/antitermination NusG family protein, partial [Enterobacter hormaechei]